MFMKKLLTLLLALVMVFSVTACGKGDDGKTNTPDAPVTDSTTPDATPGTVEPPEVQSELTLHENTFFDVSYNEEDGWTLAEDDINTYESGGKAQLRILNAEGKTEMSVTILAEKRDPYTFRKDIVVNGVDLHAYANGEAETAEVGGLPMVYVDRIGGDRAFYGRDEAAGITYYINATNWEDPRVPALVDGIVCTAAPAADYTEPAWPWEGEPIALGSMSQMVGTYTVTADFVPMAEALVTFETFNHDVEVIGDKVYLLSDFVLREYAFDGSALTFVREIPLDNEYKRMESANGTLVLSNFMKPISGHDGESTVFSHDGPDYFSLAPDGTWGISWFSSGESTEKYSFKDGALVGEPFPLSEVNTISKVDVDASHIYVAGTAADGSGYSVFVYDHSGALKLQLKGDPNSNIGLGSITFMAKTSNGFFALDGNTRRVVLWANDGTWQGNIDGKDIFGTHYPWFATADVMDDGSLLVVMTEERADDSAMEAIAFKVSIS